MYPYRFKSMRLKCSSRVWRQWRLRLRRIRRRPRWSRRRTETVESRPDSRTPSVARKREAPRTSCPACTSCACAETAKCSCHHRTVSARPTTRAWCAGECARCHRVFGKLYHMYTVVAVSVRAVHDRRLVNRTQVNITTLFYA